MSVRTDVINLIVNVNGNQSQAKLNELRKSAADVRLEMDGLKKGTQEYMEKAKQLRQITAEMDDLKKQIGITALTQKELVAELNKLKALKGSVVPFTKEFNDLEKQIKAVESRLYDVKNGVTGFSSFFSKITDEVKQFGAVAAAYLGFQFITSQITNIVSGAGRLSDQLADIRAKTGMTAEEAKALNTELGKADTRTATKDLRDIATVGGQLGVAKKDIEGFTLAVDKMNVTLGDEFDGNVEELTNRTAKLRNTFGELRTEHVDQDLLHIGNALQVLAQDGVATAPVVTDLAQRIGASGTIYGMTAGQVFGLSASYQELGITSERGGTATVKLLQKISAAPDMFFDIVKSVDPSINSLDKFKNLINTDITKAFLLVSKGFAQSKGNATEFADKLADAEIGSAAISEVLSKVGQNTDKVAGKIKLAGDALNSTSSIEEQFAIKNETFGATLDKLGKEFNSLATSGAVTGFLQSATEGLLNFIRWLKDPIPWLKENAALLVALTTVTLAYAAANSTAALKTAAKTAATILDNTIEKIRAAILATATALTTAYGYAKDVLTGKIKLATVAQQAWNLILKANPLVLIISLVGAAATAYVYFANKVKELTLAQKLNQEVQKRVAEQTAAEIGQAQLLFGVLQNKNIAQQQAAKVLKQLIDLNPEYLQGLNAQNIKTKEGKDILDNYISSLKTKAQLEAKNELLKENYVVKAKAFNALRSSDPKTYAGMTDEQIGQQIEATAAAYGKKKLIGGDYGKFLVADKKFRDLGINISETVEALKQIKILEEDVTKAATDNMKKAVTNAGGGSASAAIDIMKLSISKLEDYKKQLLQEYNDIVPDAHYAENLKAKKAQIDALTKEIARRNDEKLPEEKRQEKTYAQLKKQAEDFYKDVETLRRHANNNEDDENTRAIAAIKNKYGDLVQKITDYNAELAKSGLSKLQKNSLGKEAANDIKALLELEKQEIGDYIRQAAAKNFEKAAKDEYDQAKLDLEGEINRRKDANVKAFQEHKKTFAQFQHDDLEIEKLYTDARILLAKDYAATVKQAGEDVVTETRKQQEQITNDLIAQTKAREAFQEKEASARQLLEDLGANKGNNAARRAFADSRTRQKFNKTVDAIGNDLSKSGLDSSKEAVMATEQYKAAFEQMQSELAQNSKSFWQSEVEQVMTWVGYVQQAFQGINQILTNAENRRMQAEIAANEKRKKSYADQLQNKLISQARYDLQVKKMDEQQDKDQKKLQHDQAKREKGIKIFEAIINTAAAVAKALPNIPLSVAAGVIGAIQVAAIASEPIPALGTGGALKNGPYHSDASGGLHVINPQTGKVEMMLERDEGVLKGSAMRSGRQYTVSGTPSQITSALNALHGGVNWEGGARVVDMPQWWAKPAQINPNMPRILATGGNVSAMQQKAANEAGSGGIERLEAAMEKQNQLIAENTAEIKTMKTKLHAVVSIKEYREEEKVYDAAVKQSGF